MTKQGINQTVNKNLADICSRCTLVQRKHFRLYRMYRLPDDGFIRISWSSHMPDVWTLTLLLIIIIFIQSGGQPLQTVPNYLVSAHQNFFFVCVCVTDGQRWARRPKEAIMSFLAYQNFFFFFLSVGWTDLR